MQPYTLDPTLKKQTQPPKYSRYIYPGSPGREILRLMEWRGSLSYTFSRLRKEKAALRSRPGEDQAPSRAT
jgi:hypothetical protein